MLQKEPIRMQVVIPLHQPLTTTDADIAAACDKCYLPLIDAIEKTENLRVSLHFNGHLLDFLARKQEDLLLRIKNLSKRGQVEVLGGLFYGGIPALLPEMDVRGQIEMSGEFWDSFLGVIPKGFWLPELAWTPELPRLLEDSGLEYGFIASGQLHMEDGKQRSLGCVERGGQRVAAFVLDSNLSQALPSRPVDEWVQGALDIGVKSGHNLLSVWVRGESLGLEPGTHAWCHKEGWLLRWFSALAEQKGLETVLPGGVYPHIRPVEPLRLRNVCAPELHALGTQEAAVDWTDFPFTYPEVDTLYRRLLRASARLREAIGIMEDEELEETWSDKLATAQRLVFGAESTDAYWRGLTPGFTDPAVRDATMARIQRAESMIDSLVQGDEDWLSTEEEDLDGDLSEEVFVATRHMMVWLAPGRGADIRSLDDRASERNVLDVGSRRVEPFFAEMGKALPRGKGAIAMGRRGEHLMKLTDSLPSEGDGVIRRGIRQWVVEQETTPQQFFAGSALELSPMRQAWDVTNNGIDEDGDCSYTMALGGALPLQGGKGRVLHVVKELNIPIDAAALQLDATLKLEGGPAVLWALEIPVRLGQGAVRLTVDGKEPAPSKTGLSQVSLVRLEAADGEAMELAFPKPCELWWTPLRTTVRDLEGYRAVELGTLLVPHVRVEHEASLAVKITLIARPL